MWKVKELKNINQRQNMQIHISVCDWGFLCPIEFFAFDRVPYDNAYSKTEKFFSHQL